jgi:ribose transport system substrate-binding protein
MKIPVRTGKPTVALFMAGLSNEYLKTWAAEAQAVAAENGVKITVFDGGFNAATQYDQMQNALQSKKYDAWITISLDGNLDCKILSQEAPAAGIVVLVADTAICNRATLPFLRQWQPGTLAFVSGENSVNYLSGWLNDVASQLHGSHKVALLTGPPPPVPTTVALDQVLAKFKSQHPNLDFVDVLPTDYTPADALAKTQTILQSHPDVDTILSVYSDDTRGVVAALTGAGKLKRIKVIDIGAEKYDVSEVLAGNLLFTVPYTPVNSAKGAMKTLLSAFQGVSVQRTVDVFPPYGSVDKPLIIDGANARTFKAQY